jgi:DNA repair protein RadA/Sms
MAKGKTRYVCSSCGTTSVIQISRCHGCGEWNTFQEEVVAKVGTRGSSKARDPQRNALPIHEVPADSATRIPSGIGELDRVLGGGAVLGGVVLVGGDPGVGKSTLLLQALAAMGMAGVKTLYVSGEESRGQTALRARRLGVVNENLWVQATNELSELELALNEHQPQALVVDSVQTLRSSTLESAAGTVSQLREVTSRLVELSKYRDVATFLIGHVTKDGALAGPKVLEHLVDTVLSFEGERGYAFRTLRTIKNRFGSATELGLFEMTAAGLQEVTQPSALFLAERPEESSGSVVAATCEGQRSLLVEVQALVGPAGIGLPRRTTTGVDSGRLAMLLAVLGRRAGIDAGSCDVFVNLAGGLRMEEPALDLAVALAVASSVCDRAVPANTAVFGEVGLAGEVRGVTRVASRIAEARTMGFEQVVLPATNVEALTAKEREGVKLIPVKSLEAAVWGVGLNNE